MNYKTKQKEIILKTLKDNENTCFSAIQLKEKLPFDVSKATMYRCLQTLCDENIITKYYNDATKTYEYQYYLKKNDCNNHLHLKCNKCGKLYHLNNVIEDKSFIIDYANSIINGTCKNCCLHPII